MPYLFLHMVIVSSISRINLQNILRLLDGTHSADAAMSYWEYIYSLTAATSLIVFHASSFEVNIVTEILTSSKYCHTLMLDQSD